MAGELEPGWRVLGVEIWVIPSQQLIPPCLAWVLEGFQYLLFLWLEILPFFREQILCFSCIVVWGPILLD